MQRRQFLTNMLAAGGALALPALPAASAIAAAVAPTMRIIDDLVWERYIWDEVAQKFVPEAEYNRIEKLWYNGIIWC